MIPTSSSSIVVSTTAADAHPEDHAVMTAQEEEDLRTKPRGFFADQFEVGPQIVSNYFAYSAHNLAEQEQL